MDKNTLHGIITERDIVQKVVFGDLNPHTTTIGQVMDKVHIIDLEQTIVDAARLMRDLRVRVLVVVKNNEAVGVISERDIVEMDPSLHHPG